MSEAYIPLEDVAGYEGVPYNTLIQRIKRNPTAFKTKDEPRESGKPRTLVAVSSLSPKARKLYRADHRAETLKGDDIVIDSIKDQPVPWYVETDYHWYIDQYPAQVAQATAQTELMREFTDYCGSDRTEFSERFAAEHSMTQRTLYRTSYLTASAWALKLERETGRNHDFIKMLALCRKPKGQNKFPSIGAEVKALIENVWFDEKFRRNLGTVQRLYEKLAEKCEGAEVPYPSYATVARYVQHLMSDNHSAAYLAE